ncbi:MAG: tetratricopeptide repeat protein [Polyangiaceae bacterium]|nr:tetratricopeptide repeat protein [Polyangiaceae bacterium]
MKVVSRRLAFRTRVRAGAAALAIAGNLVTRTGHADPASDARVLFARARAIRLRGDCATALPLFRHTFEIYREGLGSLRNIAECEEEEGHYASARRAWSDLGQALVTRTDARYDGWAEDSRLALARLAPRVGRLAVDVVAPSPDGGRIANRDARVMINGEALAPELLGIAVDRDPGTYVVEIAGGPETRAELGPGDVKWVTLEWPAPASSRALPPLSGPAGERANGRTGDDRAIVASAWAASALGAAALTGAAIGFIVREHAIDDIRSGCPNFQSGPCDPSLRSAVDRGRVATTLGDVFLALGGAGVVAGVTLFAIHQKHVGHFSLVAEPGVLSAEGRF